MIQWYIYDEETKEPIATEVMKAVEWLTWERKVVKQEKIGDVIISTVFLGLDHSWWSGKPLLWETMIFDHPGDLNEYQERYSSYGDAVRGHEFAVNKVKESLGL